MLSIDDLRCKFVRNKPVDMSGREISGPEINSLGYRTVEFDTIDWKESVVLFGCSNAFGIGLAYEDTISSQLENLLGRPVVNLGIPAGSLQLCFQNQLSLYELCPSPFAVVNLWTSTYRNVLWADKEKLPIHIGPWVVNSEVVPVEHRDAFRRYWDAIMQDKNRIINALNIKRTANIMWKDTKHVELTFFPDTAELFRVPFMYYHDTASDGQHPGPKAARKTAEMIRDILA